MQCFGKILQYNIHNDIAYLYINILYVQTQIINILTNNLNKIYHIPINEYFNHNLHKIIWSHSTAVHTIIP